MARADDLATLGLTASASHADIRTAFRARALGLHPDHGGDAQAMAALNEAYERLVEPSAPMQRAPGRAVAPEVDPPDDFTIGHSMMAFVVVPVILAVILFIGVFSVLSTIL